MPPSIPTGSRLSTRVDVNFLPELGGPAFREESKTTNINTFLARVLALLLQR